MGFIHLDEMNFLYEYKFEPIRRLVNDSVKMIKKVELELRDNIESINEKEEDWSYYENHLIDELIENDRLTSVLYSSALLTVYSLMETELFAICEIEKKRKEIKISAKEVKGIGIIDQYKNYLIKVIGLNSNWFSDSVEWKEIKKYQMIRNSFAHKNGCLDRKNASVVNDLVGLKYNENSDSLSIYSSEFLNNFIKICEEFLFKISKSF